MHIQHNDLRIARKRSQLTQTDLSFILDLYDYNTVSKWEHGQHRPALESLLSYHLIFDLPIEAFFDGQKKAIAEILCKRIPLRIHQLQSENPDHQQKLRIAFLETVLTKITALFSIV
jgi:transcriptional regulator with XRE-family HTH domain